jgi:hypothetical protein
VLTWPAPTDSTLHIIQQSVAGATFSEGEPTPSCAGGAAVQTVWFKFTYTASPGFALLVFGTFLEGPGVTPPVPLANAADFDTVVTAYVHERTNHSTRWQELACNDDFSDAVTGTIPQSRIYVSPLQGTHEYYIQVARKVSGSPNGTSLWAAYNNY